MNDYYDEYGPDEFEPFDDDENEGDENEGDENEGDENEGDENEGDENEGDENEGLTRLDAWRSAVENGETIMGFEAWQQANYPTPLERADRICFADPGGRSALRASSPSNPRNLPCPTCGEPNRLTPLDRRRHYQCDSCADRAEGWGD